LQNMTDSVEFDFISSTIQKGYSIEMDVNMGRSSQSVAWCWILP
jgi:hypothetical protein